jgi:hypothetical protein
LNLSTPFDLSNVSKSINSLFFDDRATTLILNAAHFLSTSKQLIRAVRRPHWHPMDTMVKQGVFGQSAPTWHGEQHG